MVGIVALPVKADLPAALHHDLVVPRIPARKKRPSTEKVKTPPSAALEALAANLMALRTASPQYDSQAKIAKKAGMDQRTVGRIINKEHEPTLAQLSKLGDVFDLKPWQLLVPGLSATNPPLLAAESGNVKTLLANIAKTKEALEGYLRDDGNTRPGALDE